MSLLCLLIGHKFKSTGTVLFGLFPAAPVCERCGKYAGSKAKPVESEEDSHGV